MKSQTINWPMVLIFTLIILVIGSLFVMQALQSLDKAGLKSDLKNLQSLVTETQLTLQYQPQSTHQYMHSHLIDIAQKADEISKKLQSQRYTSEILMLKAISSSISTITANDLENLPNSSLEKDKQVIKRLLQQL